MTEILKKYQTFLFYNDFIIKRYFKDKFVIFIQDKLQILSAKSPCKH